MGAWADAAFERLQQIEGANHEALQRAAQIRHQVLADAPYLWQKVVSVFEEEIGDFSKKRPGYIRMEHEGESVDLFSPQMHIQITFNPQSPRLIYEVWKRHGPEKKERIGQSSYTLGVYENEVWLFDDNKKLRSTSEVAENILDWLIQFPDKPV